MNLIAFSGPRNCVNTQYAALSGAMCGWGERLSVCDHLDVISNVLGALTTVEHSVPLVQYAACHKSYPFQEKFPAIVIRNSSIISRFVSIGLHAGIQEFSSGGASWFICHKKIKNLRQRFSLGFLCPQRNFGRHIVIAQSVRVSVRPSRFVSGAYLLDSLR